jgi:succinyl-diaminopimelate desuccinylase
MEKNMILKEKIIQFFKEKNNQISREMTDLLAEMVRQKTVNVISEKLTEHPYLEERGEEYRVADIVKREFEKWSIPFQVYARNDKRPNVIGSIGSGQSGRILFIPGHMDVVPAGEGWDSDPFEPVVKDGKMYGRGTLDNKGPLVAAMVAGKIMKDVIGEENIQGILQVAALSDEEAIDPDGVDFGIEYLLEDKLISPTYAIIPDIGYNMKKIEIAEKGRVVYKIKTKGKQAHGSTPELGVNAIYLMAKIITLLEKLKLEAKDDPTFDTPTTINLGEIHGGEASNIVPNQCFILLDIRIMPDQTPEGIKEELEKLCKQVADDATVEITEQSLAHKVNPDSVLVKKIKENCKLVKNYEPGLIGFGGGTFAKSLNLKGVESVGFGPGDDTAFHVENEYVEIQQLVDFALIVCLVTLDLV